MRNIDFKNYLSVIICFSDLERERERESVHMSVYLQVQKKEPGIYVHAPRFDTTVTVAIYLKYTYNPPSIYKALGCAKSLNRFFLLLVQGYIRRED